jgi:hypothetical protein
MDVMGTAAARNSVKDSNRSSQGLGHSAWGSRLLGHASFEWRDGLGDETFGFRAASAPVFGRKGDAPEPRRRLKELNGYFRFTSVRLPDFHDLDLKFLARLDVADVNQLAARDALVQKNQRAMRIDHRRKSFLGESVSIGPITRNDDSNGEHDTMAAPRIRIFLLADRNGSHKSSPGSPVRGQGASFKCHFGEQFANQSAVKRKKITRT